MPPPSRPSGSDLRARLETDGYVVLRSLLPAAQLAALRAAATRTADLARAGSWPHVRVVGKQFPPWDHTEARDKGIWGVQHLLCPSLPDSGTFAGAYFSEEIVGVARDLLGGDGCRDEDLVMELFNMLVRPGADFELRWHRDDVPPGASAEEEVARLAEPAWHAQYNLALFDDASLVVVPGSHRRARTDAERAADPYEPDMAGQLAVELGPGDVVFYDNNILHRGVYDSARERMTLHGSVGHVAGSAARARNVLQHGVGSWVGGCRFDGLEGDGVRARAEGMRERLVRMGREAGSVADLGFSQTG